MFRSKPDLSGCAPSFYDQLQANNDWPIIANNPINAKKYRGEPNFYLRRPILKEPTYA